MDRTKILDLMNTSFWDLLDQGVYELILCYPSMFGLSTRVL